MRQLSTNENETNGYLPLTPAQKWLMMYFDYPYSWTGYTQFTFKQSLHLPTFKKALMILANRYDALRCLLERRDDQWLQRILPEVNDVRVIEYDCSDLTKEKRQLLVQDLIEQTIRDLQIDQWPLWKVIVIKEEEARFNIVVVGHHLISDVITNQVIFKEMWRLYGEIQVGTTPDASRNHSYQDFIQLVENKKNTYLDEYVEYWKGQFPEGSQSFQLPIDFNRGPNNEASSEIMSFMLSTEDSAVLLNKAKKHLGANVYPILLAPLYKMLGANFAQSNVIISHRVHGRDIGEGSTFIQTPGNFAVNFPLGVTVGSTLRIGRYSYKR